MEALFKKTWFNPAGQRMRPNVWHPVSPKWKLPKGTETRETAVAAAPAPAEEELPDETKKLIEENKKEDEKKAPPPPAKSKSALEKL